MTTPTIPQDGVSYSADDRKRLFFQTAFYGLGALAKADGRVSEAEIEAARNLMTEMRLGPAAVRQAIECFGEGKRADFPLRERVLLLRRACRHEPELLRTFLEIQMDFVLGKPAISSAERALLHVHGRCPRRGPHGSRPSGGRTQGPPVVPPAAAGDVARADRRGRLPRPGP